MKLLKKIAVLSLTFLSIQCLSFAGSIPWRQKSSFHFAKDIELSELVRAYTALQGINVYIHPEVQGKVNGKFEDLSPEEFLGRLSRAYSLTWFYDGNQLYIYPAQKVESTFLNINELAANRLLETISNLGLVAPHSNIRLSEVGSIAFVSGPPKYVEIITGLAERLSENLYVNYSAQPKIQIFPLKYAWAYDTSFNTQESTVTIPGVATVLRGLMETGTNITPGVVVTGQQKSTKRPLTSKIKTYKRKFDLEGEQKKDIKAQLEKDRKEQEEGMVQSSSATLIQPDVRLNAIIVRDVEEKMPQYEAIIKTLDVPVQIVEISVAIADVNTTYSRELGNKFFGIASDRKNLFYTPSGQSLVRSASSGVSGDLVNLSLGALVNGYDIITDIKILESDNKAHLLAQPSILTLNNIEAEINQTDTFYVSLIGQDSSDLAEVTAATSLKVTPRVFNDNGVNKIKLLISIEDGSIDATSSVGGLPRTKKSSVHTQAVIREGQSLLIGGFYRKKRETIHSGLPFLKNIPLFGLLVSSKTKTVEDLERMFVITPRLIDLNHENSPDIEAYFDENGHRKNLKDKEQRKCMPPSTHQCSNQLAHPSTVQQEAPTTQLAKKEKNAKKRTKKSSLRAAKKKRKIANKKTTLASNKKPKNRFQEKTQFSKRKKGKKKTIHLRGR